MTESRSVTEVAVAVLTDPETGKVLLGSRPEGKPYAGWWELPGGKLEPGESVHEALVRELKEELALTVTDSVPWFVMEKSYPHAYVRLHFRRSASFLGTPVSLENQEFRWVAPENGVAADGGVGVKAPHAPCGDGDGNESRGAHRSRGFCAVGAGCGGVGENARGGSARQVNRRCALFVVGDRARRGGGVRL